MTRDQKDQVMECIDIEAAGSVPPAPEGMRYVGLCRSCRDFVDLDGDLGCKVGDHGRERIAALTLLEEGESKPHLPSINWGALLMPALWGPAHGQWYLILMYPIWLFLDNIIYTAVHQGGWYTPLAAVCVALMLGFMVIYGRGANTFGYLRVAQSRSLEAYLRRERVWAVAMAVVAIAFVVFATWYNLAIRPGLAG